MKSVFTGSMLAFLVSTSVTWAGPDGRAGVFDPAYAKARQEKSAAIGAACSENKNLIIYGECLKKRGGGVNSFDGDMRGTAEYCKKHYKPLTTPKLKETATELATLRHQARHDVGIDSHDRDRGEVSVEDLTTEYRCVHDLLLDRGVKIGFDLGGTHIPDGEICEEIDCQPGRSATPAPAAPGASSAGNPIEDVTDALRSFNRLFD